MSRGRIVAEVAVDSDMAASAIREGGNVVVAGVESPHHVRWVQVPIGVSTAIFQTPSDRTNW